MKLSPEVEAILATIPDEAARIAARACYWHGYADATTSQISGNTFHFKPLGEIAFNEKVVVANLGDQLDADHARHRTAESDRAEDR